jgi:hypothetical protein
MPSYPFAAVLVAVALGDAAPTLNESVVRFCRAHVGKQVGDGECTALAHHALRAAHAKTSNDFPPHPGKGDFVWGKLACAVEAREGAPAVAAIRPGDVVQYRHATFKGRQPGGGSYTLVYEQHTAVVAEVDPRARELVVLEQNVNGRRLVRETRLRLADLRTGWLRVYRPVPE